MINYKELKKDDIIYLVDKYVAYEEEKGFQYTTKPYHSCRVFSTWEKDAIYVDMEVMGEIFCRPFAKSEETNHLFITEHEYKKMKMTEAKVWKTLNKTLPMIDLLDSPSEDLIKVQELILKYNNK